MQIFALLVMVSCKSDETIVIWHDKEDAVINELKTVLNENEPEINVQFLRRESLTEALKLVGNSPKSAPDMFIFAHDKIGFYAEIGILEPMTSFFSNDELAKYVDLTIAAATYKDVVYQLPLYYETLLFMYNKARLSEAEVPETTEELYTYMKEKTDSRRYGFVEQHSNAYYSAGWIHGFGGKLLDENGVPALNSEETIKALKYHLKFLEYMPKGQAEYATVNTMFYEKRANSIIGGPWLVPLAEERGIDLGFAPMPLVNETGLPISPYAGVQGVHVLKVKAKESGRRSKISKLLKVFNKVEAGTNIAFKTGAAPALKSAYDNEIVTSNKLIMAMKQAAENSVPMPNLPEMDIVWLTAADMLVAINLNNKDVVAEANKAQAKTLELIEGMK